MIEVGCRVQTPKVEKLASLERDLHGFRAIDVVPAGLKISWSMLDEGQGIANTLKMVLMIGALHIEDKMHQMIGKLLKDSGWSNILTQAQVLTSGRAQSVLDEHHIKRTRYAHQVSLVNLYLLQQKSYTVYCSSVHGPPESPEMWIQRCRSDNPMFMFWATITDLEPIMCCFICSLRDGRFPTLCTGV